MRWGCLKFFGWYAVAGGQFHEFANLLVSAAGRGFLDLIGRERRHRQRRAESEGNQLNLHYILLRMVPGSRLHPGREWALDANGSKRFPHASRSRPLRRRDRRERAYDRALERGAAGCELGDVARAILTSLERVPVHDAAEWVHTAERRWSPLASR